MPMTMAARTTASSMRRRTKDPKLVKRQWEAYRITRDPRVHQELLVQYLPLVRNVAGRMAHDFSIRRPVAPTQAAVVERSDPDQPTLHAVATTISEEELLGLIDMAIEGPGFLAGVGADAKTENRQWRQSRQTNDRDLTSAVC